MSLSKARHNIHFRFVLVMTWLTWFLCVHVTGVCWVVSVEWCVLIVEWRVACAEWCVLSVVWCVLKGVLCVWCCVVRGVLSGEWCRLTWPRSGTPSWWPHAPSAACLRAWRTRWSWPRASSQSASPPAAQTLVTVTNVSEVSTVCIWSLANSNYMTYNREGHNEIAEYDRSFTRIKHGSSCNCASQITTIQVITVLTCNSLFFIRISCYYQS